ncbi:hypothetical protein B0H15DRAFT_75021 [Mycena belliarum]|uniref:Uncharacterized protein n=1 Tax=Mycena belliarum TaxID=1033014 RepID=A0AAD6XQH6_9AGAR|nr:hypothetical protein B0H15DRAFT_75021 [Mycena belliae]
MQPRQVPITPSASPAPASGSRPFFPAPYRIADGPSPLKRQRQSSTPRARGSSSATPDGFDIGHERQASAMRMLDIWSHLGEKYSRPMDEDDIVDLVTGEIVKDRGVLSSETTWKIGRFADIEDSTGSEEDDDDDIDELDALGASDANEEVSVQGWTVPPVREMDPADAKDLEEFMEAEKRRRDECGEEEASEEDEDIDEHHPFDASGSEHQRSDSEDADASVAPASATISHEAEGDDSDDELNFLGPSISPTNPAPRTPSPSKQSAKARPAHKPHTRLQLPTPPKSRTPSSVLSPTDAFPSNSPPSSPLPSSQSSSPTKAGPNSTINPTDPSLSHVRTRSQSRARSCRPRQDEIRSPIPRLDLAEITRGRSIHKSTRAQSSVPKRSASGGQPKASTSSTAAEPNNVKQRELKSSAELRSPSSPQKRGMPEGTPVPTRRSLTKQNSGSPVEHFPVSRFPKPIPQSSRKRKRNSLSSEGEDLNRNSGPIHPPSVSPSASTSRIKVRSSSVSTKVESKRAAEKGASCSESESEQEPIRSSSHRRVPPPMPDMHPYYQPPGSFYPYPPYAAPGTDIRPAIPLEDPRTQFIISQAMQAMHQLSALYAAPWSAQPFTPPRRPPATPSSGASLSYPTTPHHPHAYPYVFESGASAGTLPPSSPPGSSPSSPVSSPVHGASRRSSLVPRSRSRGRRVSFWLDEEPRADDVGVQGEYWAPSADRERARREPSRRKSSGDPQGGSSPSTAKQKDKGKNRMVNPPDSEGSDAAPQPRSEIRPRPAERAQTPGPPVARANAEAVADISPRRRSSSVTSHKPRGKARI